jgi:hypothetical protein
MAINPTALESACKSGDVAQERSDGIGRANSEPCLFDPGCLPDDAFITSKELAVWGQVALVTVERWRANEKGPPATIFEGCVRYRVGNVRRYFAEREQRRPSTPHSGKSK